MNEISPPPPSSDNFPENGEPARLTPGRRHRSKRGQLLRITGQIVAIAAFLCGVFLSMKLGIAMASRRTAESAATQPAVEGTRTFTLGHIGDPVYLAEEPDALRRLFASSSGPGDRASRDLTGLPIRRITSPVEMRIRKVDADIVEVEILSGSIAGAVYWVHHSQMPDPAALDPIISPVPTEEE